MMAGPDGAQAIKQVLEASSGFGQSVWAIATGVVTFLVGATVVFAELQSALNKIWDVEAVPRRGVIVEYVLDRLRSFTIALGVGFLLLVSLVISATISALQSYLNEWMPGVPALWQTMNIVTSFFIAAVLFAMIYKYLPDAKIAWKDVSIGAAVTAALFTAGKYVISLYLGQTAVASASGAAGSFAVLLIWIYYSALISFFGAEFTQVYARLHGSKIRPDSHAVRVGNKPDKVRTCDETGSWKRESTSFCCGQHEEPGDHHARDGENSANARRNVSPSRPGRLPFFLKRRSGACIS